MHRSNAPPLPVNILLVEDNEDDALIARHAFRSVNVEINLQVAADGCEALKMLRREKPFEDVARPSLILLDLNMPRMDGRELLSIIKHDENLRSIPVIVLTTSDANIDVLQAYDSYANAFMAKPIDFIHFKAFVDSLADYWLKTVILPPAPEECKPVNS